MCGVWCEWWVKGLVRPGPFQASGGGDKTPEVGGGGRAQQGAGASPACAPGHLQGHTKGRRRGAGAGLEEESTGWSEKSVRRGKGAAKELPASVSRERGERVSASVGTGPPRQAQGCVTQSGQGGPSPAGHSLLT